MKKTVTFLSLLALLFTSNLAMARGNDDARDERNDRPMGLMSKIKHSVNSEVKLKGFSENGFVVMGTVKSVSSSSFVVTVEHMAQNLKVSDMEEITIKTDSDTKFRMLGNAKELDNLEKGLRVIVKGEKDGSNYIADWVQVKPVKSDKHEKKKVMGEVTAKTSDSVTIKNSVTGATTTIDVNDDTTVRINGEAKELSDVKVGDKGFVKIKNVLGDMVARVINLFR